MTDVLGPVTVDGLRLRRVMGLKRWGVPEPFGPDGWRMLEKDAESGGVVIASCAPWAGYEIVHASMSFKADVPTYWDLTLLHEAVFGDGYAYQVFVPEQQHVNIHSTALHLGGRSDGVPLMPTFGLTLPDGRRSI